MKKGCIGCSIALAVVAAGLVGLFFIVWRMTGPVAESSDRFLAMVGEGRTSEAYASMASAYRNSASQSAFEQSVRSMSLDKFASASWTNRNINNDRGEVEGTVTTKSGDKIPVKVRLISEQGTWRVFEVEAAGKTLAQAAGSADPGKGAVAKSNPPSSPPVPTPDRSTPGGVTPTTESPGSEGSGGWQKGGSSGDAGKGVPSENELAALVTQSLLDFDKAVEKKDFSEFHASLSRPFREQHSAADLQKAFQVFIEKDLTIAGVKEVSPTFSPAPSIDGEGALNVKGSYPTQPARVSFDLRYIREGSDWKLLSIQVNMKQE